MAAAIRQAATYVHVEFYILQCDETTAGFFDALEDAVKRGVVVRVLLDHWANRGKPFYAETCRRLDAMGASWKLMLPVQPLRGKYQRPDLRNHRKLLVVDGHIGFMGSQNVTDSTYNLRKNIKRGLHWVDMMARVEGPVVASVNAVFLSDWYSETDEIVEGIELFQVHTGSGDLDLGHHSGPGFEFQNNLKLFMTLLFAARDHHRLALLRARRRAPAGHSDRLSARRPRRAVRVGGRRPGDGLPRAAQLLRGAAARRREDLDV